MPETPSDRLSLALQAARAGGDAILALRGPAPGRPPLAVERKADASPVTEADRAGQRATLAVLAEGDGGTVVVAEEMTDAARADVEGAAQFWCVDPLDGTKEFVRGSDEFAVCVALVEAGAPVLGVVHLPALGRTYFAEGGRAFRQLSGSAPVRIEARRPRTGRLTAVTSRDHSGPEVDALLARAEGEGRRVERQRAGSALKFGLVAEGSADLYPRPGRTMEWDTAAGQAIVEAAGGSVQTLHGRRLTYGKPGFRNSGFWVRGRPEQAGLSERTPDGRPSR